jgi:hypothetical protein
LLEGESGTTTTEQPPQYDYHTDTAFTHSQPVPGGLTRRYNTAGSPISDESGIGRSLHHDVQPRGGFRRSISYGHAESSIDNPHEDEDDKNQEHESRVPIHDQRTVLVTNLPERTTHKDLAGIIRGGRLLDIFLRNDRTATISFVEGAAEFLAYTKRTDIYLHMKRVSTSLIATQVGCI